MPTYLVEISLDAGNTTDDELDLLREQEAVRARELADQGHLLRLFRVPGHWANVGLWHATNAEELAALLDTLPLRRFMTIGIQPLDPHPSDPTPVTDPAR